MADRAWTAFPANDWVDYLDGPEVVPFDELSPEDQAKALEFDKNRKPPKADTWTPGMNIVRTKAIEGLEEKAALLRDHHKKNADS